LKIVRSAWFEKALRQKIGIMSFFYYITIATSLTKFGGDLTWNDKNMLEDLTPNART